MQVQAGEIFMALQGFQDRGFTGVADFESLAARSVFPKYVFAFHRGNLVYVGPTLPSPVEFAKWIRTRLKLQHLESTLNVVSGRIKNEHSLRELLDFLARFGLIKWEDLEGVMHKEIAIILEQLLPYAGAFTQRSDAGTFDLTYGDFHRGLMLTDINQAVQARQQLWQSLAKDISLQTKPALRSEATSLVPTSVLPHLQKWATGQLTLREIATACGEDPLQLAQAYLVWSQQGWLELSESAPPSQPLAVVAPAATPTAGDSRPIVLSLDDSKIVQAMVKRAVGDIYQVMLADNARDAMNILNQQEVALLLLDVTMPDIDGLEFCRGIRNLPQFKNLPIVMLTAKDGLFDKVKGQFAGSTHYLTKPVDRDKLLPVLEKYIKVAVPQ